MKVLPWLILGATLLGGFASAEAAPNLPDRVPVPLRIRDLAAEASGEMKTAFGKSVPRGFLGSPVTKTLAKGGKFVRYGGNVLFAASLMNDALHWFYDEAKRSADPALDRWWLGSDSFPKPRVTYRAAQNETWNPGSVVCQGFQDQLPVTVWMASTDKFFAAVVATAYPSGVEAGHYGAGSYAMASEAAKGQCAGLSPQPKLEDLPASVGSSLGRILGDYVSAHPDNIKMYLSPSPNDNELDDNPFADPTADSDRDGYPDAVEFNDPAADLNDPAKTPVGAPFETGRNTVTEKIPNGTRTTTTINYSNGKQATTVTKIETAVQRNPDGSTTTTTTTTTETTNPEGETTSRTHTSKETKPAAPLEDPNGDADGDGVPNKDDPEYLAEQKAKEEAAAKEKAQKEAEEKAAKEKAEKEAKEKAEKEAKEKAEKEAKEKQEKCEAAKREWDSVNNTCGGEKKDDKPEPDNCGDMNNVKRILQHPGSWAKDLIIPCDDIGDIISPITDSLKTKFPFSISASLNGWFVAPTENNAASTLPTKLGPIPLDWGWLAPLWKTIKTLVGIALWAWFIYWVIDRFAPRTQI